MARRIELPRDALAISAAMADKLLQKGSGDAVLLYLYLLRNGGYYDPDAAGRTLKWERDRLDGTMLLLSELGLPTEEPRPTFQTPVPKKENAPEYTSEDVAAVLEDKASGFPMLLEEVQRLMGKQLSNRDVRTLLELYDHVGLPPEVLVLLVSWECQSYQEKYGEGRRPPMSFIRSTAYRWRKGGIDNLEAADAYLKRLDYYRSREGELLNAVAIRGRKATPTERNYLTQWAEWGFSAEAVAAAYDRTVTNTGRMKWSYCNAILQRWHNENRHTLEEIQAEGRRSAPKGRNALQPAKAQTQQESADQQRRIQENQKWMRAFLEKTEQG